MPTLFFKAPLIEPILSGRKTQTLRRSVARTVMVSDEAQIMCSHSEPPICTVTIEAIDRVHIDDLTAADARREGVTSLSDLLDALALVYPDAEHLMRVQFRLADV